MSEMTEPGAASQAPLAPAARSAQAARGRVPRALAATYAYRAAGAALLALPWVQAVEASNVVSFPEGDAKLLERGGLLLLEVLLNQRDALAAAVAPTLALALVISLGGVAPEWLLLRALSADARRHRSGRGTLRRCLALGVATWCGRALLAFATLALAAVARSAVAGSRDERAPFFAAASVLALGLAAQVCLSVLHDVAEVDLVVRASRLGAGLGRALGLVRARAGHLLARHVAIALASIAAVAGGTAAAAALDPAQAGAGLIATVLHQLTIAITIGLRAVWLASLTRQASRIE